MVFGGSWGVALALAYAETHPDVVGSMVLRGVFIGQIGYTAVQAFFPDEYERSLAYLTPKERENHYEAIYKRLISPDRTVRVEAAKAWDRLGCYASTLELEEVSLDEPQDEDDLVAKSAIGAYYTYNDCWLEPGQLTRAENIEKIKHIPSRVFRPSRK